MASLCSSRPSPAQVAASLILSASRLAARVGRDLRVRVYEQSLSLTSFEFSQLGTGSMITRTLGRKRGPADAGHELFMLALLPVICVVAIVLAYGTDAIMGHLLLVVTLTMLAISAVAVTRSAPIFLRLQEFIDHMNSRLRESITGMRIIRALWQGGPRANALWGKTFEEYAKNAIRVNLVFSITDASCFFLMNVAEFAVMWLGADRVGAHAMQIGSITAFVQYVILILFFTMMAQFAILQLPRAMACLTRAAEVLDIRPFHP